MKGSYWIFLFVGVMGILLIGRGNEYRPQLLLAQPGASFGAYRIHSQALRGDLRSTPAEEEAKEKQSGSDEEPDSLEEPGDDPGLEYPFVIWPGHPGEVPDSDWYDDEAVMIQRAPTQDDLEVAEQILLSLKLQQWFFCFCFACVIVFIIFRSMWPLVFY